MTENANPVLSDACPIFVIFTKDKPRSAGHRHNRSSLQSFAANPARVNASQVDCTIPHYHALEATNAIKAAFPEHYLYDPTPIPQATWRLATQCAGVEKRGDMHVFVSKE